MTGDPIFYNGDRWAAEAEHEKQILNDDTYNNDGTRNCAGCEKKVVYSYLVIDKDGHCWSYCDDCKPDNPNNDPVLKSPVVGKFNAQNRLRQMWSFRQR